MTPQLRGWITPRAFVVVFVLLLSVMMPPLLLTLPAWGVVAAVRGVLAGRARRAQERALAPVYARVAHEARIGELAAAIKAL